MGIGRSGRAKGVKILIITGRRKTIVATYGFYETLWGNSSIPTEFFKIVGLDCDSRCLKYQFVNLLLVSQPARVMEKLLMPSESKTAQ